MTVNDVREVRRLIVNFMRESYNAVRGLRDESQRTNTGEFPNDNNQEWLNWCSSLMLDANRMSSQEIYAYFDRMAQDGIWGSDNEIRAASILWNIRIDTFQY